MIAHFKKTRFQIGLRLMLLLVALFCVCCAITGHTPICAANKSRVN